MEKQKSKKLEELPNFSFPLFLEYRGLDDRTLKQKLPLELFLKHEGHEIVIDKKKYVLSISDPKDTLKLEISTFRGISLGAIHFYGSLKIPYLSFCDYYNRDMSHSGYGIPHVPSSIELHRPLTKRELLGKSDRYHGYKIGDKVSGFNNKNDII